eukprot:c1319_g1_i1.p1 GENE.c1319_g1_i1~~c1319_g1_i1.p1  ORF type:complete len:495 (+),score=88.13 c1319_g1_i1:68-1486(+)
MSEQKTVTWETIKKMIPVLVPLFLMSCGAAATSTPYSELILKDACDHYHIDPSSTECKDDKRAQHYGNNRIFWYMMANTLPTLVSVAAGSHFSDVWGRKKAFLWTLSGITLSSLIPALVPLKYFYTIILPLIALVNLTGGMFCGIGIAFASVADLSAGSSVTQRQLLFALTEGMFWVGLLISPTVGGILSQRFGGQRSLFFPASCNIFCIVLFVCFVRTNSTQPLVSFEWHKINPFSNVFTFLTTKRFAVPISLAMMLNMGAAICISSIIPIWLRDTYKYSYTKIGLLQSLLFACNALGLMGMLPVASWFGLTPRGILLIATVSLVLWPAVWAMGINPFLAIPLGCFVSMYFPVVRSAVAGMHAPSEYGSALGIVATVQCFATLLGTLAAPQLLNIIGWHLAFASCSALAAVALAIVASLPPQLYRPNNANALPTKASDGVIVYEHTNSETSPLQPAIHIHDKQPSSYSSTS